MNSNFKKYVSVIFAVFLYSALIANNKYVLNGIVLNTSSTPVENVSVSIPGEAGPVYTNSDGQFMLEIEKGKDKWLVVRPVDKYGIKHKLISGQENVVIYLTPNDMDSWFDKIILPKEEKNRRDMISAFNTYDVSKLDEKNYTNIQQHLQGKGSGAFITTNSGMPGTGASVYIRGYSSLLTNNQPLYIIDGVPLEDGFIYDELIEGYNYDPLSIIDIQDISSIVVLKDAAETASYGMKGANGVILINTLYPDDTKTTINLTLKTGITQKPNYFPQLDANQFKNLSNEILFSSRIDNDILKEQYPGLFFIPDELERKIYNHDTKWQDEIYQNALMQNLNFSIKGGDAIARYGLSIGYLSSQGIFKNTSLDRFNLRLVGAFDIFSWLSMNVNSSLVTNTSNVKESALSRSTSPIMSALAKSPMLNPFAYDSDGNRISIIDEVRDFGVSNPSAVVNLMDNNLKNYRFFTSIDFLANISDRLNAKSTIGLNSNNLKEFIFAPDQGFDSFYNQEAYNVSKAQNSTYFGIYNDNQLSFSSSQFDKPYRFNANIGLRWQTNMYEEDWGVAKNTASDDYRYLQRGSSLLREIGGRNKNWNWGALYADASLSIKDKYLTSFSVSSDISSRIGANAIETIKIGDVPVGLFYALGAAWRISEENFLKDIHAIEELKLRASVGIAGNDDIGEVNAIEHFVFDHYRLTTVMVPGIIANNQLTYQTKSQINFGFDLAFLGNRVMLSANYFNNNSDNIMLFSDEYSSLGFDFYPSNSASLNTTGYELDVFSRIVDKRDFSFDLGLNITNNKTIINDIPGGEHIYKGRGGVEIINRVGERINSFYGYEYDGVFATTEEANQAMLFSDRGLQYKAGDARFLDINEDNIINNEDKILLGSFEPDFYGGLNLNISYKRWSLNSWFQGVYGNKIFNYVRYQNEKMTDLSNQSVKVLQRWQYEGHETVVPKAQWGDPVGNNALSSRWIEDGSYLRLKELTLAYNVGEQFSAFSSMKVFITVNNWFTLTNYLGYDPEFSYSSDIRNQGIDYGTMPVSKQFTVGVRIGL